MIGWNSQMWSISRLLLAIALAIAWATPVMSQESPGNPKAGRNLFVSKGCFRCHSIWESSGKKGPNLASVGMGRNLYELCAAVWSHWSKMNAALQQSNEIRQPLKPPEIRDIIAYLYYLNYFAEPGDASLGRQVFLKRGCHQCHALEPLHTRGKLGPAVYEMREFQGAITLAVVVWNHGSEMLKTMAPRQIQWPQLANKDVAHLVAFLRSSSGAPQKAQMLVPGNPGRGRELFVSKSCAWCHKTNAREPGAGPDLAASGAATSLSTLVAGLWNHYPRMAQAIASSRAPYSRIETREMEDLLAYVYWLRAYGLSGDAEVGRKLYQTKQCATCHSGSTSTAPTLIGSPTTQSPYALLAAIWNHGPKMEDTLRRKNVLWPTLDGEEMRSLIAFFRTGQGRGTE